MFQLLEFLADVEDLRNLGLSEEEIEGYVELFFENYSEINKNAEVA